MKIVEKIINLSPIPIFMIVCCLMSYWHGKSEDGWGIVGVIYSIVVGIVGLILLTLCPIIS